MNNASVNLTVGRLRHLVAATRPRQWAKNLLLYLAFLFTLGEHNSDGLADEFSLIVRVTVAFVLFCLITGAIYLFNDAADAQEDRLHPIKRHRPIASGQLKPTLAVVVASLMGVTGITCSFVLDMKFGILSGVYFALMLSYNFVLKDVVILDVLSISAGFVLRAAAGALAIDVPISPWLYVVTSLGALMIALGKRRSEISVLGEQGTSHRPALKDYTLPLVDQLMAVVAPAAVVAYTLYTFTADNLPKNNAMMLTIPFVLFGIFRYLFLLHKRNLGGAPEDILFTDRPLLINIVLWLATASIILIIER